FLREFQHAFVDIAKRDDVGAQLLRRGHASRASVTRADAAEPDAIVSADDAGIRLCAHSGSGANRDGRCGDCLFDEIAAVHFYPPKLQFTKTNSFELNSAWQKSTSAAARDWAVTSGATSQFDGKATGRFALILDLISADC